VAPADQVNHVGARLTTLLLCALYRRTIVLTCQLCGQARRVDAVALWWFYRQRMWDDRLPAGIGRLYCRHCHAARGIKAAYHFEITRDPPDAEQPPYPDEREWRRVTSRYRS